MLGTANLLVVVFSGSVPLLSPCLLFLSVTERDMFKSPATNCSISYFSFQFR